MTQEPDLNGAVDHFGGAIAALFPGHDGPEVPNVLTGKVNALMELFGGLCDDMARWIDAGNGRMKLDLDAEKTPEEAAEADAHMREMAEAGTPPMQLGGAAWEPERCMTTIGLDVSNPHHVHMAQAMFPTYGAWEKYKSDHGLVQLTKTEVLHNMGKRPDPKKIIAQAAEAAVKGAVEWAHKVQAGNADPHKLPLPPLPRMAPPPRRDGPAAVVKGGEEVGAYLPEYDGSPESQVGQIETTDHEMTRAGEVPFTGQEIGADLQELAFRRVRKTNKGGTLSRLAGLT